MIGAAVTLIIAGFLLIIAGLTIRDIPCKEKSEKVIKSMFSLFILLTGIFAIGMGFYSMYLDYRIMQLLLEGAI